MTTATAPSFNFNRFERAAATVGMHRFATRLAANRYEYELTRYYLEAAKKDRTTGSWRSIGVNAKTVTGSDARAARERARWLVGNTGYAQKALLAIANNVVGAGIITQTQVAFSRAEKDNKKQNSRVEDRKRRWMEEADVTGKMHYYEMQDLALREVVTAGEYLERRRWLRGTGRVLPMALEMIEGARLTDWGTSPTAGNEVIQGVEYTAEGLIVAYHIDSGEFNTRVERVPVNEINHVFRHDRIQQPRGLTWFSSVIPDLNHLEEIKTYSLIARRVQSAIAVIVSDDPATGGSGRTPGVSLPAGVGATTEAGDPKRFIEPGLIHRVGRGRVSTLTPSPSGDLDPLTKLVLRGIGCGFGLSYEWISGDYRDVSFASGRLSAQDSWSTITPIHAWFTRRREAWVHRQWVDAEMSFGDFPSMIRGADPYAVRFSQPHRGWGVNPLQEVNAAVKRMDAGITTLRDEVEATGQDWQEHLTQLHAERNYAATLDLIIHKALTEDKDQ
jgi:lambda family phage portal protein